MILNVLNGTIVGFAFLGVDPSSGRTSIENDLHFLSWVTEVEFALVSHVFEILKVASSWLFLEALLVQVMEGSVAVLLQRNVKSSIQIHEKLIIKRSICDRLGKLILIWFLVNVNLDELLLRVLCLHNADLLKINCSNTRGKEQERES